MGSKEKRASNYAVRVTAHNQLGYGISSNIVMAETSKTGLLPDAPKSVVLGSFYGSTHLSLNFLPPNNNGGKDITKHRIEWDSSPSFLPSNENYGSDEISIQYEQQDVVLECEKICYGSYLHLVYLIVIRIVGHHRILLFSSISIHHLFLLSKLC